METVVQEQGRAKKQWLKKKLTTAPPPEDWVQALLPDKRKTTNAKHVVSIGDWCNFSNKKAMVLNAGQQGGIYQFTLNSLHSLWMKSRTF
jgi:hypothetical protein